MQIKWIRNTNKYKIKKTNLLKRYAESQFKSKEKNFKDKL